MYYLFFAGVVILAVILGLFWLKDLLRSPRLARIVYSELVARFALVGAALCILGLLLILSDLVRGRGKRVDIKFPETYAAGTDST